jgi:hypothetical protein
LEALDNQRDRALESKQLIEIFLELNSEKGPEFSDPEKLLNYFLNQKMNVAHYRVRKQKHKKPTFDNPKIQKMYEVA